jgi:hypothetical protein
VKFLKLECEAFIFQLNKREKTSLLDVLQLYPVVPVSHHQISQFANAPDTEHQKLLEEALAEHRNENKRALEAMIKDPNRFQEVPGGHLLSLTSAQLEWLLQVLNDIRVGSWLRLGSPDEKRGKRITLSVKNARNLWSMELAGHFEYILLSARLGS